MRFYRNGNYTVCIMDDGTKIRRTEDDEFTPAFAENVDVCLTKKCQIGCAFCYEGCTADGKHADILSYEFMKSLHPYTEMALNGNDLDHPGFDKLLETLKAQKVFANVTVNQMQFMRNIERLKNWANRKLVHGIGVSLSNPTPAFISAVKEFPNAVIHTINGILSESDINALKGNGLKLLILGYKTRGRGVMFKEKMFRSITENQKWLSDNIERIVKDRDFKVVSFDNLAIAQLNPKKFMSDDEWESFYMGDDGMYTFYIDAVNGEFAMNSVSDDRYPIGNKTMDEMFEEIRKRKAA